MKRIFTMLLFMFSVYIFIQLTFNFFNTGYEMTYIVGVNDKLSAKVKEKNIKRIKNETNKDNIGELKKVSIKNMKKK